MNYSEFKEAVFAQAQAQGLTAYELYYSAGESVELEVFQTEIKGFQSANSHGACFRCLINGQMGYASTSLFSAEEAERLVEHALDNARTIESADEQFLHRGDAQYQTVEPKPVREPSTEEMIDFALSLQKKLYAGDSRVVDGTQAQVAYERSETAIDNSYGLSLHEQSKLAVAYGVALLDDGGEKYDAYDMELGSLDGIDQDKLVKKAIDKAAAQIGADVGPTGSFPVVLAPSAVRSLLSVFSPVFSAENAQKGLSLLAGKEGQTVASSCVTLMDDPFYADSYAKASFDAEGCATSTKAVVERGVLTTLLHNLKTAHVAGVKTTANASKGSYAAPVSISPYNFYFAPGDQTQDELLAQMDNGILVETMTGLHAGASAVSGDFSLQCTGYLVEKGKKTRAIRNFTVADNFFELLKKIEAAGSDMELGSPSGNTCFGSPSLLIRETSLAGK